MLDLKQIESYYPDQLRPFKKNLLREYLQHKILEGISESPLSDKLVFMGGTCIHIVHGSPRFSEDLDFDNLGIDHQEFSIFSQSLKRMLELQGYTVDLKVTHQKAFRASLRFPGLLHDVGVTGPSDEKLMIQIDTEPQNFQYAPDKYILNKFDVFTRLNIVPVDILLARKIFCIFNRSRPMGRDFFDVVFLLGKSKVNMDYVRDKCSIRKKAELKEKLLTRSMLLDFNRLARDLEPFVYSKKELDRVLLFQEVVEQEM
jgi:predicted nucleotidyltransferase component of viral defense system